jgi:hypothetical protein
MFLLLNGSFGIGKTTTARLLVRQIAGASIYDPEMAGIILQRLPAWMLGRAKRAEDFQDIAAWRRLTSLGARLTHFRSRLVVVPMAFTNLDYFEKLRDSLNRHAPVVTLCLVAPMPLIEERISARALAGRSGSDTWALRRAEECCRAHISPAFGQPVDATQAPGEIVADIRLRIGM